MTKCFRLASIIALLGSVIALHAAPMSAESAQDTIIGEDGAELRAGEVS
jgi:hypothetical protein